MKDGDKILKVDGVGVTNWETLKKAVGPHAGEPITVTVDRNDQLLDIHVTPLPKGDKHAGKIMIAPYQRIEQVGAIEAARLSLTEPPKVVYDLVEGIAKTISERLAGKEDDLEFVGPVGIFKMTSEEVQKGLGTTLQFLGRLSAYLAGMNLLPIPALDGGRLLFLLFEATSRRRADAKVEAKVHALALVMMLSFMVFLTYGELIHPR
jgi:regulator of sigma E protease